MRQISYLIIIFSIFFGCEEAKKEEVGKKGLIKNYQTHSLIIGRLTNWLVNNQFTIKNITSSPIKGQTGNKEFLVHLKLNEYFQPDV